MSGMHRPTAGTRLVKARGDFVLIARKVIKFVALQRRGFTQTETFTSVQNFM